MRLRSFLIISYVVLVLLLVGGMALTAARLMDRLGATIMAAFVKVGEEFSQSNLALLEKYLRHYGGEIVADKATDVARDLGAALGGQQSYDYTQLRRNQRLRAVATQVIRAKDGVAGYVDVIDRTGVSVWHPNPEVEGKNFSLWQHEFPEMWRLVSRAFREERVTGYYTFIDQQQRPREKFMALVQVPETPFIVVAAVNIDEFFTPVQREIEVAWEGNIARADQAMTADVRRIKSASRLWGLAAGGVFCLAGGIFAVWFASRLSRPLSRLQAGVQEIGKGDFAVAVPQSGPREVAQLAQAFNELGQKLIEYIEKRDFIRDTFGRYVTLEVVKRLLESDEALALGGELREVSLIMSDLRGFTALTAAMHPEQVVVMLNRYLGKMIEILLDHRAVIDEILGDGILAFFGAPEAFPDHAARAVACALAMQAAMEEINRANAADGFPHLEMGIAVNTGPVVVGNIGSERRTKYSVIGSPVNFAGRMESCALGGQVLVSAATHDLVQDRITVRRSFTVDMKGVPEPALLYEVVAVGEPYNIRLPDRPDTLTPLPRPLPVRLLRLREKIVCGTVEAASLVQLSETGALAEVGGSLELWEDVRLHLETPGGEEAAAAIYAKVTRLAFLGQDRLQAVLDFTSVSPGARGLLRQILKTAGAGSPPAV